MSVWRWLTYFTAAVIISAGVVGAANRLYNKIGLYHKYSLFGNEEKTESIFLKLFRLYVYNTLIAISATGLIFVYALFAGGADGFVGFVEAQVIIIGAVIMNFCIRVLALTEYTDINLYKRSLAFGYSFILSIYFLSFFGISTFLITNDFALTAIDENVLTGVDLIPVLGIVIIGPLLSMIASESILALGGVKDEKIEDFNEDNPDLLGWGS